VAGLLNGLVGVGGGIVIVPGLIFVTGLSARAAISTSLGAVMCLSSIALAAHLTISGFHLSLGGSILLLGAGIVGAQLGGMILNRMPQRTVLLIFAGMTMLFSTQLMIASLGLIPGLAATPSEPPWWSYPIMGGIAGIVSGLLGVGGGGLVVLGFALVFRVPVLGWLPVALAVNAVNAASGVVAQRGTGNVRWAEVFRIVPASLFGMGTGIIAALLLPPDGLRIVFALVFFYMGLRVLLKTLRAPPSP
jgi:uncharacterized membrane protein YfcA